MSKFKKRLLCYKESEDDSQDKSCGSRTRSRPSVQSQESSNNDVEIDVEGVCEMDQSELFAPRAIDYLAGRIESLQMTNFMCHSNLELKLNSRINFITGKNGSGKSAIMAALIVALGGTAALTGRGSGVVDFIKKGETWARVNLILVNEGINAFRKDVYGKRILITRNLSKTTSNTYVIKSENGVVVSRKKEEIDNIVLALNLQIKNPICILNQDVARNFLCASDTSVRFTMFARATQLEHLKTIYMKTLELLVAARKQLKYKIRGIEHSCQEIAQIREKLTIFANLEKHVHERTRLENEYVWALVVDEEKKFQSMKAEKMNLIKKKKEILQENQNFEETKEELEKEMKELEGIIKKAKESNEKKRSERVAMLKYIPVLERKIERAQNVFNFLTAKINRQLSDINAVKEHLGQDDSLADHSDLERIRTVEKIKVLQQELVNVRTNLTQTQASSKETQEKRHQVVRNLESLKSDHVELEQNRKRLELLLNGAKTKNQNNLIKFGHFTPDLVAAINDAADKNYFTKKPVGPCGLYVTLTGDMKWARAVESVVGGLMTSYCCDNQKDFLTLSRIMEKVCGKFQPPIIISKFIRGRHNVESGRMRLPGVQSVLDVLTFENDVVYNTFVDQARIESIGLFETDSQAAAVMSYVRNVPKNLRMGLTIKSDQYFPAPNYRTYYGDPKRHLKYFERVSKAVESIARLELELKEAAARVQQKNREIERVREEYSNYSESLKMFETQLKELKQKERKIELDLNQMKDIEESRPVRATKKALEEELHNLQKVCEETKQMVVANQKSLDELIQERGEVKAKLDVMLADGHREEVEAGQLEASMDEKKFKVKELCEKNQSSEKEMAKINRQLSEIAANIKSSEKALATKKKEAEEVCPERVDTSRTPVQVKRALDKTERYIKTAEKMAGSREEAINEYKSKVELYNNMRKTERVLASAIETLTKVALKKERRLSVLQSHTASLVSFYFQATLQTRGYDGQLKVDFEDKILEIEVKPKDGTTARKDTKTLSGGERSYSMVAFILAIWKVVHMPFYFLDEFDVFMDKVNRKVIMELLLEHSSAQASKQFVFITPQDISNIKASEYVSIFKLPDPERKRPGTL